MNIRGSNLFPWNFPMFGSVPGSQRLRLYLALLLGAALAACSALPARPGAPQDPFELEGTRWVLRSLHGDQPLPESAITLQFTDGWATGDAGCNSYGGEYEQTGENRLEIPEVIRTLKLCVDDALMQQEDAYLDALQAVSAFRVADGQLHLENAAGETTLVFAPQE